MSWQPGSDIGVQALVVGRDGLRLEVVGLRMRVDHDAYAIRPAPAPRHPAPFRRVWIQAASPPPPRVDGCPWYEPFGQRRELPQWLRGWQEAADSPYGGLPKLSRPSSDSIVLHQQLTLAYQRGRQIELTRAEPGDPMGFPANDYPQATEPIDADFYGEYELAWTQPLSPDAWVALSFDRFEPDSFSTPFLMRVADVWLFDTEQPAPEQLAPEQAAPKGYAAG